MDRKLYEPTERQAREWSTVTVYETPSDEWFKADWKNRHHGKVAGWGMGKRDWLLRAMTSSPDYQRGLWQGRVDAAQGLDYAEERNENTYNLGYYRGYTEFESNYRGWDPKTRERFDSQYRQEA